MYVGTSVQQLTSQQSSGITLLKCNAECRYMKGDVSKNRRLI